MGRQRNHLSLALYIGLIGGVGLSRVHHDFSLAGYTAVSALVLALLARRSQTALLLLVLFVGLGAGSWRGAAYRQQLSVYGSLYYRKITVTAQATNDALYGKTKQLAFDAGNLRLADGERLPGRIQLSGFGTNAVFQGDAVEANGKLYPGYGSYQGRMSYAELTVSSHHPTFISRLRQKFTAGMQTALPEPLAPFAMGLLVGQRANLPNGVKQDLLMVGLTHIIAVSGYNLTIILRAGQQLFGRTSRRLAVVLSLLLIGVFLLLAGASASIVRAAIVSMLSIVAGYYGRAFKPLNLICLAAAITALMNPVYVWSDLSWYLSFLAFYGVLVLAPLIQRRLGSGRLERWFRTLIGSVVLESLCAEVMSLPFILYIFGQLSLIGLPANALVVTLVPLAMLLSLAAGIAGMYLSAWAGWLAWPATWLLNYMLDIAHLLASLPHVFVQNRSLPLAGMLGLYAMVGGVTMVLSHKTKQREECYNNR